MTPCQRSRWIRRHCVGVVVDYADMMSVYSLTTRTRSRRSCWQRGQDVGVVINYADMMNPKKVFVNVVVLILSIFGYVCPLRWITSKICLICRLCIYHNDVFGPSWAGLQKAADCRYCLSFILYIAYWDTVYELLVTHYELLVTPCELLVTHVNHLGNFTSDAWLDSETVPANWN